MDTRTKLHLLSEGSRQRIAASPTDSQAERNGCSIADIASGRRATVDAFDRANEAAENSAWLRLDALS
jgi:hypothetical protein